MGSDFIGVEISGLEEFVKAFEELGKLGSKAALENALSKAAVPVAEEARRLAPRDVDIGPRNKFKQHLPDTIVIRRTLSKSQMRKRGGHRQLAEVFVGSTAPHAHLVEFGHLLVKAKRSAYRRVVFTRSVISRSRGAIESRAIVSRGRRPIISRRVIGHVPAHPFMRPAFDAKKEEFLKLFSQELGNSLLLVARRYRRQAERGKLSRGARIAFKVGIGL